MRVVALEEHFSVPALVKRIDPGAISRRGYKPRKAPVGRPHPLENLPEIGEKRLKSMDDAGITMGVLSNSGPGPDLVPGPDGVATPMAGIGRRGRIAFAQGRCHCRVADDAGPAAVADGLELSVPVVDGKPDLHLDIRIRRRFENGRNAAERRQVGERLACSGCSWRASCGRSKCAGCHLLCQRDRRGRQG